VRGEKGGEGENLARTYSNTDRTTTSRGGTLPKLQFTTRGKTVVTPGLEEGEESRSKRTWSNRYLTSLNRGRLTDELQVAELKRLAGEI